MCVLDKQFITRQKCNFNVFLLSFLKTRFPQNQCFMDYKEQYYSLSQITKYYSEESSTKYSQNAQLMLINFDKLWTKPCKIIDLLGEFMILI